MAAWICLENAPKVPRVANAQKDGLCVCSREQRLLPLVGEMSDTPHTAKSEFIVSQRGEEGGEGGKWVGGRGEEGEERGGGGEEEEGKEEKK